MKKLIVMLMIASMAAAVFTPALLLQEERPAQPSQPEKKESTGSSIWTDARYWISLIAVLLIGFLGRGGIPTLVQFFKRIKDAGRLRREELKVEKEIEAEKQNRQDLSEKEKYCACIKKELGYIDLLGSPEIVNKPVQLEEAFVSLCISEYWRSEERFDRERPMTQERIRHLPPEKVMERAFQQFRLLLVIGDPGSGKTTLLKYYAISCLDNAKRGWERLGFRKKVLPLYFPLRELEFKETGANRYVPASLPESLARWAGRRLLEIPDQRFLTWLQEENTLVLLDGLDEISSKEKRQAVCKWIKEMANGLDKAYFVVTSRATGYRKLDGIELEVPHLRADIMDFSPQQQTAFLEKWFRAVYLAELPPPDLGISLSQWQGRQIQEADQRAQTICEFLQRPGNKALRELAAVPMLLQIMAIIWKYSRHLPQSRSELYDAALDYLLDYRDRYRDLMPLLRAEKARGVLKPTALWMQESLIKDEVVKKQMHDFMQPILDTLDERPAAPVFCDHLRERAGVIAEYDSQHYIFRHKSFREYLAALQLAKEAGKPGRLETLVSYFKEDWWEETLRFFITQADADQFDGFMWALFQSPISRDLDDHKQTLLQNLVGEAPQKKIEALETLLKETGLNDRQRRCILEVLKTIGSPQALAAIKNTDKTGWDKGSRDYAGDIIAATEAGIASFTAIPGEKEPGGPASFRNPFEENVEYIKIPGGTYTYSVTGKAVEVNDFWLCKYPVTNKLYRVFIRFLAGGEKEPGKRLSLKDYTGRLLEYAGTLEGYSDYLGKKTAEWPGKFRSYYDKEKNYNGPDQPVVGVTWYAARAYCFWLSCLEAALKGEGPLPGADILAGMYRLPTEIEWEWAAGGVGEPDGTIREYPWPKEKGDPNPNLANYNKNVGTTTPGGRYPEGATPQGLMDMAGNVWEWMENLYEEKEVFRALRGGSWYTEAQRLRCRARDYDDPVGRDLLGGFRVLRSQSL